MKTITSYSSNPNAKEAVNEIRCAFANKNPKAVLYFASSKYNHEELAREMKHAFGNIEVFGCSTFGGMTNEAYLEDGVVAYLIDNSIIGDIKIEVIENISKNLDLNPCVKSLEGYYGEKLCDMSTSRYVGMILFDALSFKEEEAMDKIGNLTNFLFVGCSAADAWKFEATYVYYNGIAYRDACLIALMKTYGNVKARKVQSMSVLEKTFTVTKTNPGKRQIVELNNRPAAEVYAETLGIPVCDVASKFIDNPVGVVVDGEPYVRVIVDNIDGTLQLYCDVAVGTELSVLQSKPYAIIKDIKNTLAADAKLSKIVGCIAFTCAAKKFELEKVGQLDEYRKAFEHIPTVGIYCYGEEFIGHLNNTTTMLLFTE